MDSSQTQRTAEKTVNNLCLFPEVKQTQRHASTIQSPRCKPNMAPQPRQTALTQLLHFQLGAYRRQPSRNSSSQIVGEIRLREFAFAIHLHEERSFGSELGFGEFVSAMCLRKFVFGVEFGLGAQFGFGNPSSRFLFVSESLGLRVEKYAPAATMTPCIHVSALADCGGGNRQATSTRKSRHHSCGHRGSRSPATSHCGSRSPPATSHCGLGLRPP